MSIINKIKNKKELQGITNSIVEQTLKKYLKKKRLKIKDLNDKDKKIVIKEIRAELRDYVGRFQIKSNKKGIKLLEQNKIRSILETHSSTKERLLHYKKLKSIIKKINPKSILDLACGLNPIATSNFNHQTIYYASDINEEDLNLVRLYFKKNKIKGKTFIFDIKKNNIKYLPKVDLCFILKTLDILKINSKQIENLLKNLKCKYIIVSFSTKTLSGKKMKHIRRPWLERILTNLTYSFNIFKTDNEIFYLISKKNSFLE